jgi:hypothetical protein
METNYKVDFYEGQDIKKLGDRKRAKDGRKDSKLTEMDGHVRF